MAKDRFMKLEIVNGTLRNRKTKGECPLHSATARVETAGDIDRRVTATRLILTGPLAFGLRKKKDSRELWFTVEGEGFSYVEKLPNFAQAAARKFAARINGEAAAARARVPQLAGRVAEPSPTTPV